jgi:DNA repair protein RadD
MIAKDANSCPVPHEQQPDAKPMRDYQRAAYEDLRKSLASGHRHTVLQAATGCGKTRIAAEIIRSATRKGNRTLFLAPRRELIYQSRAALAELGLQAGIIMAGEPEDPGLLIQVASFDTLHARTKTSQMRVPPADLVIVDECHLAKSPTRMALLSHYENTYMIGLTATPAVSGGRGLGGLFHHIVFGPSTSSLMEAGFLVPVQYYSPREPNLAGVKTFQGDYQQRSLSERMNTREEIAGTVRSWRKYARDRSTVVFCVTREHGQAMLEAFKRGRIKAEYLDGDTPLQERSEILARVASGRTQVLVNILVATFGTDIPRLSCAILARPTQDVTLYLQTVGRILRPCQEIGKVDAMVLDNAGAVLRHGFVDKFRPWSLDGSENISEATERSARERGDPAVIVCTHCRAAFSGVRECPRCSTVAIPPGQAIPIYRIDTDGPSLDTREGREAFVATGKALQIDKGYKDGWLAHRYFECYGVWPSSDLKSVPPQWSSNETLIRLRRQMSEFSDARRVAALRAKGLYGGEAWSQSSPFF